MYKSGILERVLELWKVSVPAAVYEETVQRGREEAYPDAEAIDRLIAKRVRTPRRDPRAQRILQTCPSLGKGEREALYLLLAEQADAVVSDDRAFLRILRRHNLPGLPPALVLPKLVEEGKLSKEEALQALERMRPLIRREAYLEARTRLEGGGG